MRRQGMVAVYFRGCQHHRCSTRNKFTAYPCRLPKDKSVWFTNSRYETMKTTNNYGSQFLRFFCTVCMVVSVYHIREKHLNDPLNAMML